MLLIASGVARRLKWATLLRSALLPGDKNHLGETGQYQGPLVSYQAALICYHPAHDSDLAIADIITGTLRRGSGGASAWLCRFGQPEIRPRLQAF
jgi:hypothetical protein